jgi:hypothetical protein
VKKSCGGPTSKQHSRCPIAHPHLWSQFIFRYELRSIKKHPQHWHVSSARDDAIIDGRQKPTFYVKPPHPILDGVVDEQNAKSRGVGDDTAYNFVSKIDLPSKRSFYPTYSEFVNTKLNRDADSSDDGAAQL